MRGGEKRSARGWRSPAVGREEEEGERQAVGRSLWALRGKSTERLELASGVISFAVVELAAWREACFERARAEVEAT